MGMDGVLANPDILKICFSYFDPDTFFSDIWELGTTTRRRLLSTALTCKAFYEPAMSLLWRMMESIHPLLKILPGFTKMNETYGITGLIQPAHMDRLLSYAKHIQYIFLCGSQEDSIAGHTLLRLSHLNPPIFPALVSILVSIIPSLILRNVDNLNCLFLAGGSPALKILSISDVTYSTEDFVASFLAFAAGGKAHVEDVRLRGRLSDRSLGVLGGFGTLRRLDLAVSSTTIRTNTIADWAALGALEELIVKLDGSSTFVPSNNDFHFQTLKTLDLTGSSTEIAFLLLSIASSTLISLSVSLTSLGTSRFSSDTIDACIHACALLSPRSLQHLKILASNTAHSSVIVTKGALLPLARCSELYSFELSGSGINLPLMDIDIEQLCHSVLGALSYLEILKLPTSPIRKAPSLRGVHELTRMCPRLHTLMCAVDWSEECHLADDMKVLERTMNNLRDLTVLRVSASLLPGANALNATHRQQCFIPEATSLSLAISVSRFLEYHFPNLKPNSNPSPSPTANSIRSGGRSQLRYTTDSIREAEWWENVVRLVPEWRVVREEGRREGAAEDANISVEGIQPGSLE